MNMADTSCPQCGGWKYRVESEEYDFPGDPSYLYEHVRCTQCGFTYTIVSVYMFDYSYRDGFDDPDAEDFWNEE